MPAETKTPAWEACSACGSAVCTIHGGHVESCACPDLEFWDSVLGLNPFEEGGGITSAEIGRLKAEHHCVEE